MYAAVRRVQRHLVVVHHVDRLDDVDLPVVRPERALCPKCGPHRATVRDVQQVDDPETAVVIEVLASDTDLDRGLLEGLFVATAT